MSFRKICPICLVSLIKEVARVFLVHADPEGDVTRLRCGRSQSSLYGSGVINLTRIHQDAGSTPALAGSVGNWVCSCALVQVADEAWIWCYSGRGVGWRQ